MSQQPPKTIKEILDEMTTGIAIGSSGSSGGLTIGTASTGTSIFSGSAMQAYIDSLTAGMTKEELAEYEELKKVHNEKIKLAKITEFKKLPPELRQFIINAIAWHNAVETINNVAPEKDPRFKELEDKDQRMKSGMISIDSLYYTGFNTLSLPKGISNEDLKHAHLEATLEEQVLNPDPNGNTSDVVE
jgi:hypothetical protein